MCRDCGCQQANKQHSEKHSHWVNGKLIVHSHGTDTGTPKMKLRHSHTTPSFGPIQKTRRILLEESILAKNDRIAAENRNWFQKHKMRVLNLISAPGSGKTLLLEKTIQQLNLDASSYKMALLTGDQEYDFDAQRLRAAGTAVEVKQLNTASSCHLDASMIAKELGTFVRPDHELLVIENVGNLVCPAAFDLGESQKVALLSCTEGEDKPSKYPLLFHEASVIVITKIDLIPHLDWRLDLCVQHIRRVNTRAPLLYLSARTGEGLEAWINFVRTGIMVSSAPEQMLAQHLNPDHTQHVSQHNDLPVTQHIGQQVAPDELLAP